MLGLRGLTGNLFQMLAGGVDDELAIAYAVETIYSMIGNPGQESIIEEGIDHFTEWADLFLEHAMADDDPDMASVIGDEKYDATDQIWAAGVEIIYGNAGHHDSKDEQGEGTGA